MPRRTVLDAGVRPGRLGARPGRSGRSGQRARRAFTAAVVLTVPALLQQVLLIAGFGELLPGWQPWPFLLLAAPAWWVARPYWSRCGPDLRSRWSRTLERLWRIPPWGWIAGAIGLTAVLWAWFQSKEPHFAHEEAVYANKARSWADGTPDAGWGIYRPVGLPALGRVALAVHDSADSLRIVALILTLFTLVVVFQVAARWTSSRRGVVVVLLLLSGLGFLRRTPEFLNDIAATGLLLLVVFWIGRAQEGRPRALVPAALAVVAAFYLRYGVAGNLLAIGIAALLAYGPRAWLREWRWLGTALGILVIGLCPHFLYAATVTGSPLGMIFSATEKANRVFVGDGVVYYLAVIPYRLAGDLGGVVVILGLIATFLAIKRFEVPVTRATGSDTSVGPLRAAGTMGRRRTVFLGSSGVLIIVVLGVATDGEPRFIYLPLILFTILGVGLLADIAGSWSRRVLTATAALAGITILGTAQIVANGAMPGPERLAASTVPVARKLASDSPCLLVTGYEPEMGWYSGCDAVTYTQYRRMGRRRPSGVRITFVRFDRGRLQPTAGEMEHIVGGRPATTHRIPTRGAIGDAIITHLR